MNGRATNNMAEIQAVTIAARQAQKGGIKKLKISTDSQFLIKCITQWMPKWKRCGWQTSNGKPVINKTELIEMEKALAPLEVRWVCTTLYFTNLHNNLLIRDLNNNCFIFRIMLEVTLEFMEMKWLINWLVMEVNVMNKNNYFIIY